MKKVSILLITVVLICGMLGCEPSPAPAPQYDLTIFSSTGGSVAVPGEGTFTYEEGMVINLITVAEEGYQFLNWTGDVGTIADINAAATTITINSNYSITANFEEVLKYDLTIASTEGGSVTTPGEGTFTYDSGTVVDLVATPDKGYQFVSWTGDVGTVADGHSVSTTIAIHEHYAITANFAKEIWDWYDLHAMRDDLGGSYILMNDLDSTTAGYAALASPTANGGKGWEPVGAYGHWDGEQGQWLGEIFRGVFYGQGYEIRNLFIQRPDEEQVGLFGHVSVGGVIEDIGVTGSAVIGGWSVGGLVGWNADGGTIRNSYYSGSVTGNANVGGLVGYNHGTISNSHYNYDQVLINGQHIITIGALFAEDFQQWLANDGFLDINERLLQEDNHYVIGNVSDLKQLLGFGQDGSLKFRLKDDLDLGNDPDFYIPYLAAEFDGNGHRIVNLSFGFDFAAQVGLFGFLCGDISEVGAENITITGNYQVGGLAGCNWRATVSCCYSTGSVTGGSSGGLVGGNWGTVSNSYSTASVHGSGGGLVGVNVGEATVRNSYSTGNVASTSGNCGLVGWGEGTVSNSFWDIETSGETMSAGGTGKTTAEMKDVVTFADTETQGLDEPWDVMAVAPGETNPAYTWNIVDGETYPFLSWQSAS